MIDGALIRYNFRVLMHHNGWLLSIPLAASQLTVFWTATTQRFSPSLPSTIVELVSPLLGAFLCAHLLSAEYRSGVGAMLASKPVDIRKVVLVRLSIALALVWFLAGLSLLTFHQSMEPYPLLPPLGASVVSTLFLSLLSLTFATLFRHPLAGFAVAALYWLLDLPPGPPMNPFLSLKSLASSFHPPGPRVEQPLTDPWWIAKGLLLLAALTLYLLHNRLLFLLGTPMTLRRSRRALAAAAGLIALYVVSGAVVKVGYGYTHRGALFPSDVAWFRRQFGVYGMLPVSALFGRNFQRYLGAIPNSWRVQQEGEADLMGDTEAHRRDLKRILEVAPRSVWAPSAAEQIARFEAVATVPLEERVAHYRVLVDRYPDSPYAPSALLQVAQLYAEASGGEEKARAAYALLLERYPRSPLRPAAYRYLAESDLRRADRAGAERNARLWVETAPVHETFVAWVFLADLQRAQGQGDAAKASEARALAAIDAFFVAAREGRTTLSEPRRIRVEGEARALAARLKGGR